MILILGTALLYADFKGNAVVGTADSFPEGLFAASSMFPEDTLIEIVNIKNNTSSKAVIIGNSSDDGILVTLSPVLAKKLGIAAGTVTAVKISIPPHVPEEGADPSLSLKKRLQKQPHYTHKPAQRFIPDDTTASRAAQQPIPERKVPTVSPNTVQPTETAVSIPEKTSEPIAPDYVNSPTPPKKANETEPVTPKTVDEPIAPQPTKEKEPESPDFVNTPVPPHNEPEAEPVEPKTVDEPIEPVAQQEELEAPHFVDSPIPPENEPETEPVTPETVNEPVTVEDTPAFAPPYTVGIPVHPKPAEAPVVEDTSEESDEAFMDPVPLVAQTHKKPAKEEAPIEAVPEAEPIEEKEKAIEDVPMPAEVPPIIEKKEDDTSTAEENTEPLLIEEPESTPAEDENTPKESDCQPPEENFEEDIIEEIEPVEEPVKTVEPLTEDAFVLVPTDPREPIETEKSTETADTGNRIFNAEPEEPVKAENYESAHSTVLTKGNFYVQVGCFLDSSHVADFMHKYKKDYPILVEEQDSGSCTSYKIYVGPLERDERGAILETFQEYGFTDAFLKKAQ